jgi:hypothetical protein
MLAGFVLEAEERFHKILGYEDLWILKAALERHVNIEQEVTSGESRFAAVAVYPRKQVVGRCQETGDCHEWHSLKGIWGQLGGVGGVRIVVGEFGSAFPLEAASR